MKTTNASQLLLACIVALLWSKATSNRQGSRRRKRHGMPLINQLRFATSGWASSSAQPIVPVRFWILCRIRQSQQAFPNGLRDRHFGQTDGFCNPLWFGHAQKSRCDPWVAHGELQCGSTKRNSVFSSDRFDRAYLFKLFVRVFGIGDQPGLR